MKAFTHLVATVAPFPAANIDTDQIIPARFLKTVGRAGLKRGLFSEFRFDQEGREKPDFVLNQPGYRNAGILVAGDNFGCGSSREHAPWALLDFGISCVISTSFADIFYNNCFQNGLLPVVLKADEVQTLIDEARGANHTATVDLAAQTVTSPTGQVFTFQIDPQRKAKMLGGLDSIGETLIARDDIDLYESKRALAQPWLEQP